MHNLFRGGNVTSRTSALQSVEDRIKGGDEVDGAVALIMTIDALVRGSTIGGGSGSGWSSGDNSEVSGDDGGVDMASKFVNLCLRWEWNIVMTQGIDISSVGSSSGSSPSPPSEFPPQDRRLSNITWRISKWVNSSRLQTKSGEGVMHSGLYYAKVPLASGHCPSYPNTMTPGDPTSNDPASLDMDV
ncbi:hypothetical protein Tco_1448598 [Tanacetum coccineum]